VLALAEDPDPEVRAAALGALARMQPGDGPTAAAFAGATRHPDALVRSAGMAGLLALNAAPADLAPCVEAATGPSPALALRAVQSLHRWKVALEPEAWRHVVVASVARGRPLPLVTGALAAVAALAPAADPVLDGLLDAYQSTDQPEAREALDRALEALGSRHPHLADLAVKRWQASKQGHERSRAGQLVRAAGARAAPLLLVAMGSADAEGLADIGWLLPDESFVKSAPSILRHGERGGWRFSLVLKVQFASVPGGTAALAKCLRDPDRLVRIYAAATSGDVLVRLKQDGRDAEWKSLLAALDQALAKEKDDQARNAMANARSAAVRR
jgi:hypothetical protein